MANKNNHNTRKIISGIAIGLLIIVLLFFAFNNQNNNSPNENQNENINNAKIENTPYKNYKVKLYLGNFNDIQEILENPTSLNYPNKISDYLLRKTEIENGKEFYGKEVLYLYSNYSAERILCDLGEYYDGKLNSKFQIIIGSGFPYVAIGYEKDNTPKEVKYLLDCKGVKSGIEYTDSYIFDLIIS